MNTLIRTGLLACALLGGSAMAAQLTCKVTAKQSFGGYSNNCFGMSMVLNNKPTTVNFRIENLAAPVKQVIWSNAPTCSATSTTCAFPLYPYSPYELTATILYQNGTYEETSATAMYETGF